MPKHTTARQAAIPAEQSAHADLIRKLNALKPPRIPGQADADAVAARIEHLRRIRQAVDEYVDTLVINTIDHCPPGGIDYQKADEILFDAISDSDDPDYDLIATLARAGCRFAPAAPVRAAA